MRFYSKLTLALATLVILPTFAFAQANDTPDSPPFLLEAETRDSFETLTPEQQQKVNDYFDQTLPSVIEQTVVPESTVSCFDYYEFGSVEVDFNPTLSQTVPGSNLTFAGTITNQNDYPVVDGQVYVKIFYTGQNGDAFMPGHGYPLVDQFALPDTYVLPGNGELPASFTWSVPASIEGGDYMAAFFFQSAKRFNLLGLSFTDDVTGNQTNFSVTSDNTRTATFNKSAVTLNDKSHTFTSFLPHFDKDEVVTVGIELVNSSQAPVATPVTWSLYAWDSLRSETLQHTLTEMVELEPGETKRITYDAAPIDSAVSYLVVETVDKGSKSILDIRWIRDGVAETRINFPSITKYPLLEGEVNTLFSCLHSTNLPIISDNTLSLEITNKHGEVVHTYDYTGDVTGAMMGVKSDFSPIKSLSTFTLTATLLHEGEVVEKVVQHYDCTEIDPANCLASDDDFIYPPVATGNSGQAGWSDWVGIIVLLLIMLAVPMMYVIIKKQQSTNKTTANDSDGQDILAVLFLMVISGALMFATPTTVLADSVSANVGNIPALAEDWVLGKAYTTDTVPLKTEAWGAKWLFGLEQGASASILYSTELFNDDTGQKISNGSSIPVGTKIRIERTPAKDSDIFWNGTGRAFDTPYGYWIEDAGPQPKACHDEDQVGVDLVKFKDGSFSERITYILLDVDPVAETVVAPSANLACTGNVCTVTAEGPVSIGMQFPSTYGRFYYRYLDPPYHYGGGCRAVNTPMRVITNPPDVAHSYSNEVEPYPFDLIFPEKTITFTLSATGGLGLNTPPTTPTIDPATPIGTVFNSINFTVNAIDPDGDKIRYEFDWDDNNLPDELSPALGYVTSGTSKSLNHSWATDGNHTFKVRAVDDQGGVSAWSNKEVIVGVPTGNISATKCIIPSGSSTCSSQLSWLTRNAMSPNVYHFVEGITYSTSPKEDYFDVEVAKGHNIIQVRDGSNVLGYKNVYGACDPSTTWDTVTGTCVTLPSKPVVTPNPASGEPNAVVNFSVIATDVDSAGVRYMIDWDLDYNFDEYIPSATGFVTPGVPQAFTHSWSLEGTYDFRVYVSDENTSLTKTSDLNSVIIGSGGPPAVNQPPAVPIASFFPITGEPNEVLTLTASAVDPDDDNVAYDIDWDNDSVVDESLPASGFTTSSNALSTTHSWPADGTYTVQVRARDDQGNISGWKSLDVIISTPMAAPGNQPPSNPTVSVNPTGGEKGEVLTFTTTATDPDGDTLAYDIDWDNDNSPDQSTPATGFVTSGTSQDTTHSWATDGTYTVQVRARDDQGDTSGWVSESVLIETTEATLSGTGCTIADLVDTDCNGQITWDIKNASAPNVYNQTTGTTYSTADQGTNQSVLLQFGANVIQARDGSVVLQQRTLQAGCDSATSFWDGTKCGELPTVSLSTSPQVIRSGNTATVDITITSDYVFDCEVFGAQSTSFTFTHNDTGPQSYPYTTDSLYATQVVEVSCDVSGFMVTEEARIEVEGDGYEI